MNVRQLMLSALPLTVRRISLTDPVLTISGADWSMTLMCPWTLTGPGVQASWESDHLEDYARVLVGRSIVGIKLKSDEPIDPTFVFEGGFELSIEADTDFDPWTLMLPDVDVIGLLGT